MATFFKKFKNIAFTVFALSLMTVLFSFKFLEKRSNVAEELVWFQADNAGNISSYIDTAEEPGGNCSSTLSTQPRCAVGMEAELFDGQSAPYTSPISKISDDPSLVKDERHLEP